MQDILSDDVLKGMILDAGLITEKEKIAGQPFFEKSENGDKVLIYTSTGRAILYCPTTKKIINMTTVNLSQTPQGTEQVPVETPKEETVAPVVPEVPQNVKIALYNGSNTSGVTNTLEDKILAKFPTTEVVLKEKASKSDYTGNLVIDLSEKNESLAKELAETFGGTVGSLPTGETTPQSDILIIVGNK